VRLKKQADDHLKKSANFVGRQPVRELDPETRKAMETIGYVNK
jgi:hypothetical protein